MFDQQTPFTVPLLLSGGTSLLLAGYVAYNGRRHGTGTDRSLLGILAMLLYAGFWAIAYALQLTSISLVEKQFWRLVIHVGTHGIVVSWLVFVFAYTDHDEWFEPRRFGAVIAVAGTGLLLRLGAPVTSIMESVRVTESAGIRVLEEQSSVLSQIHEVVFLGLIGAGIYLLAKMMLGPQEIYRGQAIAMGIATLLPTAAYVIQFLGLEPIEHVELTPMAFGVTGAALTFAIVRYRILDVTPIVRDTVVESMKEGYVVVDDEGTIIDYNPAAERLLEWSTEDPLGEPLTAVTSADIDGSLLTPGGTHDRELTMGEGDDRRHVAIRTSQLQKEDVGHLLLLQDVTDRRQVERRYQALIEQASDLTVIVDTDGDFVYVSPAIQRILGYDPQDLVGERSLDLVAPSDRQRVQSAFEGVLKNPDREVQIEYQLVDGDGTVRVFETVIRNLTDEPAVEGIVLNAWEVTARKERAEKLEVLNRLLRHDIRNDMQVIDLTGRLLESHVDEDGEEHLDRLQSTTDHIVDLTNTVRELMETMSGEETETKPTRLDQTLQAEIDHLTETTENVIVEGPEALPAVEVLADDMLSSVFRNILKNAIQHNDSELPRVQVSMTVNADPPSDQQVTVVRGDGGAEEHSGWVRLRIADDGPGIPDARKDVIFGRNEQGLQSDGTGVGLYLVRTLVESYGGDVWVEDSDLGGAAFVILLRLAP